MQAISSEVLSLINSPQKQEDSEDSLGQEDFLELMVTQLRNQDPFEPLQSGEFIGQLASFGTVSGIGELNNSVSSLVSSLTSSQSLGVTNLIGKSALVPSNSLNLKEGEVSRGSVSTTAPTNNVNVNITDAAGNLIQSIPLGTVTESSKDFEWDGTDSNGDVVPDGEYKFTVVGSQDNENIALDTFAYKRIESVSLGDGNGAVRLNVENGGELKVSEILKIQ